MLIVVEHFDTFHHYFLTPVYPPLYLTLTICWWYHHKRDFSNAKSRPDRKTVRSGTEQGEHPERNCCGANREKSVCCPVQQVCWLGWTDNRDCRRTGRPNYDLSRREDWYSPELYRRVEAVHGRMMKLFFSPCLTAADLRHTFATLAIQNGVDIKTLSGILGHYSSSVTLDNYTHVTQGMKQDAADKMGRFMEMKLWGGTMSNLSSRIQR